MFSLFNKKREKIVNLTFSPFFIFLFCFAGLSISITIVTTPSTSLTNHAYGELENITNSSPVEGPFDSNLTEVVKKNFTQTTNQDNFLDKKNMLESKSKDTTVSIIRDKNDTKISAGITDSTGSTSSNTNTRGQFSEVTADFNGDGFSDLAIGVPGEDVINNLVNGSVTLLDAGAVNVIYGSSIGLRGTELSAGNGRANQLLTQILTGGLEAGDEFGNALATGDFNNDGFSDLAIGAYREDIGTVVDAGVVAVIYGSTNGLSSTSKPIDIWTQNSPQVPDRPEPNDFFGSALATGDINGDGFSDLAIGVPGQAVNTETGYLENAGALHVIYGSSVGLNSTYPLNDMWNQRTIYGYPGLEAEIGDRLGSALATGDFNTDGFSDLAIGVPMEDVGNIQDAGAINVLYGSLQGVGELPLSGILVWTQDIRSIEDNSESGDKFGSALATGDFNNDRNSDLAIGVPGERVSIGFNRNEGAVNVIYGFPLFGLTDKVPPYNGTNNQIWTQDSQGIEDNSESGDKFGSALATDDFNNDRNSDLAIGVPGERVGRPTGAGSVNVIYGSSDGLSSVYINPGDGRNDQIWHQNSVGFSGAEIEDNAEVNDKFGSSLATGNFNNDENFDLAIGVPGESVGNNTNAGAVNVIYGAIGVNLNSAGLSPNVPLGGIGRDDQIWTQDSPNIGGISEPNDMFGISLG
jgi:hypothetical protein